MVLRGESVWAIQARIHISHFYVLAVCQIFLCHAPYQYRKLLVYSSQEEEELTHTPGIHVVT